jgi:hypothetical protein
MLRQCVHPNQQDWVAKLPAIEFAINSARSESTGFAPFFLNFGRMPRAMLWTSTPSTEFPSVRKLALQKKLAIMAAHDSILSARVKQTRDANRKRRDVPFKTGELVYLASKNISFAKGLARKLIPKYIGPYKILRDFGNSSFRLDLPAHLKRRGVHDVFHSSLLREHIPNDDRLFPGRMDTQLGNTPETEGEWAVDQILSHAGSKTDSVFEIKWKSGDITWLPYYQITHLQALTDYLDLYGESKVNKLPKGTGKPPQDDPQIFIGAVSLSPSPIPFSTTSLFSCFKNKLKSTTKNIISFLSAPFTQSFPSISPTIDFEHSMPPHRRSLLRSVNHPLFIRLTPTTYLMKDPDYPIHSTIHVGQVAEYLQFDEQLRTLGDSAEFQTIPIGFTDFCNTWNDGVASGDPRRISTIYVADDPRGNYTIPSKTPVSLRDFHITPAQAGLGPDLINQQSTALQADIAQEFAAIMVAKQRKQRQSYEERQEKRRHTFGTSTPVFPKYSHFGRHTRNRQKRQGPTTTITSTSSSPTVTPVPVTEDYPEPSVPDPETQAIEDFETPELEDDNLPDDSTLPSDPMEEISE